MKIEVVMPKMGESIQEGTIVKWLKKPGDRIERDEMILEISTDKVDTEVPATEAGTLTSILAWENETVEVGKVIAIIETDASAAVIEPIPTESKPEIIPVSEPEPPSAPDIAEPINKTEMVKGDIVDVVMPKMGESLQEGTIIHWLKKIGEKIERDEMIVEISTDKVDTEVPSIVEGTLVEILAKENDTIEVGKVIARISTGNIQIPQTTVETPTSVKKIPAISPTENIKTLPVQENLEKSKTESSRFYSPLVRSVAESEGVPLSELDNIQGSGADGRVNKTDLLKYIEEKKAAPKVVVQPAPQVLAKPLPKAEPTAQPSSQPVYKPAPTISIGDDNEIIQMDRMRQLISEHMVYSWHTSPHVTSIDEADITEIVRFREKHKSEFEKREGFKLTFTPFFAKAAIEGIKAFPMVNVSVDGTNIIKHRRINLSIAVALEDSNLIVPVIKNADTLNIDGLARSIYDLSTRARTKKLNPDDIQGGTFTITNFGTFGNLFGTPIINQPQTAIMGIGAIKKRPVARELNGEWVVAVRDMAYISLTFDHRVIDGMLAGKCLAAIVKSLENMSESNLSV